MTRRVYRTLAVLLYLAPVVIWIRYRQLSDRLPVRVATHFDAAGRANGWMSRGASMYFDQLFLAILAGIFLTVLLVVEKKYELGKVAWALLAFLHAEIWAVVHMLNSTLDYNLNGSAISILPLALVSILGGALIAILAIGEKRGHAFAATEVLAEEVHSGKKVGAFLLVSAAVLVAAALAIPNGAVRLVLLLAAAITAASYALAWDGFHYFFTPHGIEIRALGFRLKSIPLLQIKNYEIQSWSAVRGYGIRGIGNRKAYVWGKTGVRVETYDGEVFFGHSDPQRIVHDLNVIKRYQHS
jgi:hypothetical protein